MSEPDHGERSSTRPTASRTGGSWARAPDAYFRTGSFAAGARFVQAIGELAGLQGHRGEIDLRPDHVTVRLFTVAPGPDGLSTEDVELARQVSAVARELGVVADPAAVQSIHLSIDVLVRADVMPFWRAVLGLRRPHRRRRRAERPG